MILATAPPPLLILSPSPSLCFYHVEITLNGTGRIHGLYFLKSRGFLVPCKVHFSHFNPKCLCCWATWVFECYSYFVFCSSISFTSHPVAAAAHYRQNHCVHHHHHRCHHAFKTTQCCCSRPGCIPNSHNYIRCRTIIGSFYRNFSSPLSPYLIAYSLLLSPLSLPTYNAAMGEFLIGMCRTKQLQSIGLMCVHKKCKCSNLDRGYK